MVPAVVPVKLPSSMKEVHLSSCFRPTAGGTPLPLILIERIALAFLVFRLGFIRLKPKDKTLECGYAYNPEFDPDRN
jgi:hypothetical protein